MSQQPASITRTVLHSMPIPGLPGYESRIVQLDYPAGVAAPRHTHPVIATGIVVEGEFVSQFEGGEVETYTAGQNFVDLGTTLHVRAENASKDKPLVMVMSYLIKVGQPNVDMV